MEVAFMPEHIATRLTDYIARELVVYSLIK